MTGVCSKHNNYYTKYCGLCMKGKIIDSEPKEMRPMSDDFLINDLNRENSKEILEEIDEGLKYDKDKLRWDLLPWDAIEKIVEIMTYGAKKYEPNNWQKVNKERYYAAMMRHYVAEWKGEDNDKESELLHLAHMACNAVFLLWKKIHGDD